MSGWSYAGRDAGISLFDACLTAGAPIAFRPGMRVLEVGCCESDWLERAKAAWPDVEFVGVDQRPCKKHKGVPRESVVVGDVRNPELFAADAFDAVVSLSAIEHIGLGHYGDPKDADGDTQAIANCQRWLKPGGWLYFDVPYDPTRWYQLNTECRVYDWTAIMNRLASQWTGPMLWRGYSDASTPGTLIDPPVVPAQRYYYVGMVWRKA